MEADHKIRIQFSIALIFSIDSNNSSAIWRARAPFKQYNSKKTEEIQKKNTNTEHGA